MISKVHVRLAVPADLDGVRGIARAYGNLANWPARPDYLDHELAVGGLWVALDDGGGVEGFAGVLERGDVAYLADLFVRSDLLGQGIGRTLLEAAFDASRARIRATNASGDPRALPLYVRFGMRPLAPLLYLSGDRAAGSSVAVQDRDVLALEELSPGEPAVVALDAAVSGRPRAEDLAFLARSGARALALREDGRLVGFSLARLTPVIGSTHALEAFVAPSAAATEEAAERTILAAVRDAATRADAVHVVVPGPHPALRPLLEAGFRIVDKDTVMASRPDLMDLTRFAPSPELG